MGEEEFDMIVGAEDDNEVLRSEVEPVRNNRSAERRRLVEERLAQRNLEQQIQDYDFDMA
ncbi:MAG: hypothetical protein DRR42_04480 [Gammaproteobacteria bacterium]|nr:MAG: hypothetical protein DRR42_04480 [Gammaproteobacteria bacterium]